MKSNKLIWMIVLMFVITTIAVTFDRSEVRSQDKSSGLAKGSPPQSGPDLSKYGKADYDSEAIIEPLERERRNRISKRYDNEGWVIRNPHDQFGKIGRFSELSPPPVIPTTESDIIVIGKITELTTYLSNDKTGVYSEFKIKISQVLKNGLSIDLEPDCFITIDRPGGVVRYPGGQVVLYEDSQHSLPEVGHEYALFLRADTKSENYEIVTLHELLETKTIPLDSGRKADDIKRMGKSDFIMAVRDKLSRPVEDEEPRRKP